MSHREDCANVSRLAGNEVDQVFSDKALLLGSEGHDGVSGK